VPVGARPLRPCGGARAGPPLSCVQCSWQRDALVFHTAHCESSHASFGADSKQCPALRASCARQHVQGGQRRRAGACGRTLAIPNPTLPHPTPGVDPKSIVCEFFRHGKCTKGFKCKFAHDLAVERKGGKIDIFSDRCARLGTRAPEARVPPWSPATGPGSLRAGCALHEHFAACSACACGLVCGFATL